MVKWDRLWPGGLTFAFDDGPFKPSTDTFLLGGFASPRRNDRVCDLGAGIGLLGLLLLGREPSVRVTNIDIDPAACDLAEENLAANGLTGHRVLRADLRRREELPLPAASTWRCPTCPISPPAAARRQRGSGARHGRS